MIGLERNFLHTCILHAPACATKCVMRHKLVPHLVGDLKSWF